MLIQKGMNLAQRLHGKKKSFNGWVVERVTRNTNRLVIVMHHIAKELKKKRIKSGRPQQRKKFQCKI